MCNADSTPLRFLWDKEYNGYSLPLAQEYMCRDFDAVWKWAVGRNTTGVGTKGTDLKDSVEDVELELPRLKKDLSG